MSRRRNTKEKPSDDEQKPEFVGHPAPEGQSETLTSRPPLFKLFLAFVFGAVAYNFFTRDLFASVRSRGTHTVKSLPDSYAICTNGGTIYTVDEHKPTAECILVRKDRIHAVGSRGAYDQ